MFGRMIPNPKSGPHCLEKKHVVYLLDLSTESGIQKVLWNFFKSGPPEAFLYRKGFVISRPMDSCPKTGCRHEED